mmetsp:Transcript_873/g.1979  ORF Transcript_873/g.1979 Transcript_873/m.1979 type:complete len:211 (-) Transcript_873:231-863(-)
MLPALPDDCVASGGMQPLGDGGLRAALARLARRRSRAARAPRTQQGGRAARALLAWLEQSVAGWRLQSCYSPAQQHTRRGLGTARLGRCPAPLCARVADAAWAQRICATLLQAPHLKRLAHHLAHGGTLRRTPGLPESQPTSAQGSPETSVPATRCGHRAPQCARLHTALWTLRGHAATGMATYTTIFLQAPHLNRLAHDFTHGGTLRTP